MKTSIPLWRVFWVSNSERQVQSRNMFETNKSLRSPSERAVNYQRRGNLETPYKGRSLIIREERVMKGKRSCGKGRGPWGAGETSPRFLESTTWRGQILFNSGRARTDNKRSTEEEFNELQVWMIPESVSRNLTTNYKQLGRKGPPMFQVFSFIYLPFSALKASNRT